MPIVFVPPALRETMGDAQEITVPGATVREVIEELEQRYPGTREALCDGDRLRPGMSVSVGSDVAALGLLESVEPDDEIHFLPTLGGG